MVLNHQQETVEDILKIYNKKVSIYRQENVNGLSGAILSAITAHENNSVLILLGDLVVTEDIAKEHFNSNFISIKTVSDYSRWCMIDVSDKITFFDKPKEKPSTNYAVSGIYHLLNADLLKTCLEKQIKEQIKISNEFQFSTVLSWIGEREKFKTISINLIDFGTLEEYLQNRGVKNSRSFNDLTIEENFIIKSSTLNSEKLINEFNWFNNLPDDIVVLTPRLFDKNFFGVPTYYKMEKILAPSLREIYLFLDNSIETWEEIFAAIFSTLLKMQKYGKPNDFMKKMVKKTVDRINDIKIPIENNIVDSYIKDFKDSITIYSKPSLMHGDFCFSNLLYNISNKTLKMVDPRGELFGDHYYEMAKVFHSVLYDYDFIDAELYIKSNDEFIIYNKGKEDIKNLFINMIQRIYSKDEIRYIKLITAGLFLSMIPLHSHNRNNQIIYYNTFKKIYSEI